jgi:hypothetical protein
MSSWSPMNTGFPKKTRVWSTLVISSTPNPMAKEPVIVNTPWQKHSPTTAAAGAQGGKCQITMHSHERRLNCLLLKVLKRSKSLPLKLMTRISRTTPFNVWTSRGSIRDVNSDRFNLTNKKGLSAILNTSMKGMFVFYSAVSHLHQPTSL